MLDDFLADAGTGAYTGKLKEQFPRWAASIKALAAHENVYVKVGGLGQAVNGLGFEKQAEPPSSETVANAMRPTPGNRCRPSSTLCGLRHRSPR
jgi:L-fuconolactonase